MIDEIDTMNHQQLASARLKYSVAVLLMFPFVIVSQVLLIEYFWNQVVVDLIDGIDRLTFGYAFLANFCFSVITAKTPTYVTKPAPTEVEKTKAMKYSASVFAAKIFFSVLTILALWLFS